MFLIGSNRYQTKSKRSLAKYALLNSHHDIMSQSSSSKRTVRFHVESRGVKTLNNRIFPSRPLYSCRSSVTYDWWEERSAGKINNVVFLGVDPSCSTESN